MALYDQFCQIDPSPIVGLSRAIAIAGHHGADAGLRELDQLELVTYPYFHAARAEYLERIGRVPEAIDAIDAIDAALRHHQRDRTTSPARDTCAARLHGRKPLIWTSPSTRRKGLRRYRCGSSRPT